MTPPPAFCCSLTGRWWRYGGGGHRRNAVNMPPSRVHASGAKQKQHSDNVVSFFSGSACGAFLLLCPKMAAVRSCLTPPPFPSLLFAIPKNVPT